MNIKESCLDKNKDGEEDIYDSILAEEFKCTVSCKDPPKDTLYYHTYKHFGPDENFKKSFGDKISDIARKDIVTIKHGLNNIYECPRVVYICKTPHNSMYYFLIQGRLRNFVSDKYGSTNHKPIKEKKLKEPKFVEGPMKQEEEHDVQDEDESKKCVICLENKSICITSPCRHLCTCVKCARILCFGVNGEELNKRGKVKCPTCRKDIKSLLRVF